MPASQVPAGMCPCTDRLSRRHGQAKPPPRDSPLRHPQLGGLPDQDAAWRRRPRTQHQPPRHGLLQSPQRVRPSSYRTIACMALCGRATGLLVRALAAILCFQGASTLPRSNPTVQPPHATKQAVSCRSGAFSLPQSSPMCTPHVSLATLHTSAWVQQYPLSQDAVSGRTVASRPVHSLEAQSLVRHRSPE